MSALQQALGERLLQAAAEAEEKIDRELEKLSFLDEDGLEEIRRKRMQELKKKQEQKQEWLKNGHGEYEELPDERSFFEATKKSNKLVCHFYLPSTERCKIVDKHLRKIVKKYLGTKFVYVNAEKLLFLTQRLNIRVIPTIAIVIDSKTVDYIRGFDDLGGVDDFKTETLEWRLAKSGVIHYDGPSYLPGSGGRTVKIPKGSRKTIRGQVEDDDSDDDY